MTLTYAASTDLAAWTGTAAPANATQLLRSASLLVRDATACDYYAADPTGLPTDATILQAFKDATCAHAALWAAAGIDPAAGEAKARVLSSKGIGTARLTYADAQAAADAAAASLRELCPEGRRILRDAGLASTSAWLVG